MLLARILWKRGPTSARCQLHGRKDGEPALPLAGPLPWQRWAYKGREAAASCFWGKMRQNVGQSWVLLPPRHWRRTLLGGGMSRGWTESQQRDREERPRPQVPRPPPRPRVPSQRCDRAWRLGALLSCLPCHLGLRGLVPPCAGHLAARSCPVLAAALPACCPNRRSLPRGPCLGERGCAGGGTGFWLGRWHPAILRHAGCRSGHPRSLPCLPSPRLPPVPGAGLVRGRSLAVPQLAAGVKRRRYPGANPSCGGAVPRP